MKGRPIELNTYRHRNTRKSTTSTAPMPYMRKVLVYSNDSATSPIIFIATSASVSARANEFSACSSPLPDSTLAEVKP